MPTVTEERLDLDLPAGSERLLRYHELRDEGVPFSRQHITELEHRGQFPRRIRLSPRVIAWRRSEVRDWLASRSRE